MSNRCFFKQIITDEIVNQIVEETNHFAEQKILQLGYLTQRSKLQQQVLTNKDEIGKFIGLFIFIRDWFHTLISNYIGQKAIVQE